VFCPCHGPSRSILHMQTNKGKSVRELKTIEKT
jgi:hypothetical protein